ncbi:hypothetical protein [Prescottella agglutinans]|uniref:Uncharacterized protein n=1 Tax=Prescottella agglutinans TaxID=1644129 RepID=A0ABT6MIG1_9NOCA|nr:hypothetical protein [Prescottella agglutinans]MDH6284116.1 hypothetical protein [Prescottella agglutinans]
MASVTVPNEVLLAEGLATLRRPDIDLSVLASKPAQEQMTTANDAVRRGTNLAYFPALLAAHQSAWDNRTGFQADCRAKDDKKIVQKQQSDELDRIRIGPDGLLGTADDDKLALEV